MIKVFIESKNKNTPEYQFLKYYIDKHFPTIKGEIEILPIDGCGNIKMIQGKLTENTIVGGTNIVIFDADYPHKNNGKAGYDGKKKELEGFKAELGIEFELFLFPNNKDDGDFEVMLEKIINQNHQCVLECFNKFEQCIKSNLTYISPDQKAKMYTYMSVTRSNDKVSTSDYRFDDDSCWNIDHEYLAPLKDFLFLSALLDMKRD